MVGLYRNEKAIAGDMLGIYLNDHTALIDAQPVILVTSRFPRRRESELSRSAPEWEGHSQTENHGRDFSR